MNTKARTEAIEMFSNPSMDSPTIFLMSLKAGGVGINLTAASRVFLIDPVSIIYKFYYYTLSYDVASGSEITPYNKIYKPLVVYRFLGNVMTSITTLRT